MNLKIKPIYEKYMGHFAAPIDFLELGVDTGHSMDLWKEFLPKGSRLTGVDFNYDNLQIDAKKYNLLKFNVLDAKEIKNYLNTSKFDVIIADADPHRQVWTFENFESYVKPNGVYFIHTFQPCRSLSASVVMLKTYREIYKKYSDDFIIEHATDSNHLFIACQKKASSI